MSATVRPFANGYQYADWLDRNCYQCRFYNPETYTGECEIDGALGLAYMTDGTVSESIAQRMGLTEHAGEYTWNCPESEAR